MDSAYELTGPTTERYSDQEKALDLPDLSHHLSTLAKARANSPLKSIMKYNGIPGMVSLAGGQPHPTLFPFETLASDIIPYDAYSATPPSLVSRSAASWASWLTAWFKGDDNALKVKLQRQTIKKYATPGAGPEEVRLETALQYGTSAGLPGLISFLTRYVQEVYQPAMGKTTELLLNVGATDGWSKVVQLLCERGEGVLVENWTYPSAMQSYLPYGCVPIPVEMDGIGMLPDALEKVLAEWDEEVRGRARPHVMYTVPVGQNPTGATMNGERKKAIYDICVKYDIIIAEDDPYYMLQMGVYTPPSAAAVQGKPVKTAKLTEEQETKKFIASLEPSFLKFDYQGRVIRIDTFSKTMCPGARMGWFTASPLFIERLQRASETSTQSASGFSQAMITKLLNDSWGFNGYMRWLRGIQATYTMRRDWMCDLFDSTFHLEHNVQTEIVGGTRGVIGYAKRASPSGGAILDEKSGGRGPALISFVPPTAGMFVWVRVHLENHPSYHRLMADGEDPELTLIEQLWTELAENKVLVSPGTYFSPYDKIEGGEHTPEERAKSGYFRLAFSYASQDQMKTAITTFQSVVLKFFKV